MKNQFSRLRLVTSRQNAAVKELRRAFHTGECTGDGYCAIEGVRTIEEAIRSGLRLRAVFFSESGKTRAERLLPQVSSHAETLFLSDDVFRSAVATESPQGVAAMVRLPRFELADVLGATDPLLVIAAGIQDPGNLGTMIRSAEAFGATAVVTVEETVSAFNSKVVRASAGSLFRLPIVQANSSTFAHSLAEAGLKRFATSSHKGTSLAQANLCGGVAVYIGNEGAGVPRALSQHVDEWLVIPHSERVESLNAAIAASIVLYEAARQRQANAEARRRRGE